MDRLGQPSEGLEGGLEMAEGVLPLCTRGAVVRESGGRRGLSKEPGVRVQMWGDRLPREC